MKLMLFYVLSAFLSILLSSCVTDKDDPVWSLQEGGSLPQFSVSLNDGRTVTTESMRGKKGMIVFFNTGCIDCQKELPVVQAVYDRCRIDYPDVEVICISRNEGKETIEKYWRENGLSLPYSAQDDNRVYSLFASSVIPRIYIYSPDLKITATFSDSPLATYEDIISQFLND